MVTAGIFPFKENSHGRAGNRTRDLMMPNIHKSLNGIQYHRLTKLELTLAEVAHTEDVLRHLQPITDVFFLQIWRTKVQSWLVLAS